MRPFVLKAAATVLTLASTVASALYVTGHLKNPGAPLQPAVLSASEATGGGGQGAGLVVAPPVQATGSPPVASTYAS